MLVGLILLAFAVFLIVASWSLSKFQFSDDNDYNNETGVKSDDSA